MENILMWITIAIISLTIIGYVVYKIYEISKMTPEQRKQIIVTYLKGGYVQQKEVSEQGMVQSSQSKQKSISIKMQIGS